MQKEDTNRKQEMYTILRKWKKSSLSLRDYGEKQGITYGVMKYWHRKYRAEYPDSKKSISKKVDYLINLGLFSQATFLLFFQYCISTSRGVLYPKEECNLCVLYHWI